MMWSVPHVILYFMIIYVRYGETIKAKNSCECELDDGKVIDLKKLANKDGSPRFRDILDNPGTDSFSYNPCKSFSEGTCTNVAVCQSREGFYYNAGNQEGAQCLQDQNGVSLVYTADSFVYSANFSSPNVLRTTVVYLVCDTTKEGELVAQGEITTSTYLMFLTSKHACPFKPSGLSAGSILIIIFVCVIFVYLVGGVLFQTFRRGAAGKERIPNYSLWVQLPTLIKGGFLFVVGSIKQKAGYQSV